MTNEPAIKARFEAVLQSIFCPVAGCWPIHGGHCEFFYDSDAESFVLEVWPVAIPEPDGREGNGHGGDKGLLYELAEFDFTELAEQIRFESFHFSQRRAIFEIAWQENGRRMELRVHIEPAELDQTL